MKNLKYSDILRINKQLEVNSNYYNISLLSNVVVHQAKEIIEYQLRIDGVNANINLGNFDNVLQESQKKEKKDAIIIFWELSNLVQGLQYKLELLTEEEINEIESKFKSEFKFVINNLENCPLLIINKFTSLLFSASSIENNKIDILSTRLNEFLESFGQPNLKLINTDKVIANLGVVNSFDLRFYYSSKAPYRVNFFR